MGKMKGYFNKKSGIIAGAALVVVLGGGVLVNQMKYVNQNNLSNKMEKEITTYLDQKESEYLVYFYDKVYCETCGDYNKELKNYEKKEGALPVYKATGKEETTLAFEEDLFVDKRYPVVVHVKDGEEYFRYVGAYPINSLPLKTDKKEEAKEEPVKETAVPTTAPATEATGQPVTETTPSSETNVQADQQRDQQYQQDQQQREESQRKQPEQQRNEQQQQRDESQRKQPEQQRNEQQRDQQQREESQKKQPEQQRNEQQRDQQQIGEKQSKKNDIEKPIEKSHKKDKEETIGDNEINEWEKDDL